MTFQHRSFHFSSERPSTVSHYPRGHHASTSSRQSFPSPNGAIQQHADNNPREKTDTIGGPVTKRVSKRRLYQTLIHC
ncbi:hypothetical protein R3I94_016885 [Phoxinus phoxinus]